MEDTEISEIGSEMEGIIKKAMIVAIIVGIIVTAYLVYIVKQNETFSSVYVNPDTYSNYIINGELSFTYGVQCFENEPTDYLLEINFQDKKVAERNFRLCSGGVAKKEERIQIKGLGSYAEFPALLTIILTSNGEEQEVHFWVKGHREGEGG